MTRDWENTRFKKTVAISEVDYRYLLSTKSRKCIAGQLEKIIQFYRQANPEDEKNKKQYDNGSNV